MLAFLWLAAGPLRSQHLRMGVIGGASPTPDYATYTSPSYSIVLPDGQTVVSPSYSVFSGPRSIIGGPTAAWDFTRRLSIETNAIYRRLRTDGSGPTVTWQFPLLFKYRLPFRAVAPFLAAGPSFRTTGNENTRPSHTGASAEVGVDWQWRDFRLAPAIRYTRWAASPPWDLQAKQDQLEGIFEVSRRTASDRHPFGDRVTLGLAAGWTLLEPVRGVQSSGGGAPGNGTFESSRSYLRTWLAGPRVGVELTGRWSVSAEAGYRAIRYTDTMTVTNPLLTPAPGVRTISYGGKPAVLWQFPVLLRYSLGRGGARPFLEAGPSFRLPQDLGGDLSPFGAAAAAGLSFRWRGLHIEPGLRYSHWGAAHWRNGQTAPNDARRNQLDAIFTFAF